MSTDMKLVELERALFWRLSAPCSTNELYGYLLVLLFYTDYKSDENDSKPCLDLENARLHILLWYQAPDLEKIRSMGLKIIEKLKTSKAKFKDCCIIDHAMGLIEMAEVEFEPVLNIVNNN